MESRGSLALVRIGNKKLVLAVLIFACSLVMQGLYAYYYPGMASCNDGHGDEYIPQTVLTAHCKYTMDVGQDVTFYILFHDAGVREERQIPSHIELRDPDNSTIYEKDFDSKFVYSFKPVKFGNYVAYITSLEDPNHSQYFGYTQINYGLGFFPESDLIPNYFGRFLVYMWFTGYLLMFVGIGLGIYAVVKRPKEKPVI